MRRGDPSSVQGIAVFRSGRRRSGRTEAFRNNLPSASSCLVQLEDIVQGLDREFHVFAVDEN